MGLRTSLAACTASAASGGTGWLAQGSGGRLDLVTHASDSAVQWEAESIILKAVGVDPAPRSPRRVDLPQGTWVEVDGVNTDLGVFAQAFAHIGQKRKVALDALTLITVQRSHPGARLVLAFCEEAR